MASPAVSALYDFTSKENHQKWRGVLQPALGKIQKQVHPRMDIEEDAVRYVEDLLYHLLALICSSKSNSINDVEAYISKTFAVPINTWAIKDAQKSMERYHLRKGKSVFNLPVDKLHILLEREIFKSAIDINVVRYIAAILDYIAADILKLAGNLIKNTQSVAIRIKVSDIKLSLTADHSLNALFKQLNSNQFWETSAPPVEQTEDVEQAATYEQHIRQFVTDEEKYISQLKLILKVFQEPFTRRPDLFPAEEVKKVFLHLPEIQSLSEQLLASLDECLEMAGVVDGEMQDPQAGFVFEEIAESQEWDVYINYAKSYKEAVKILKKLLSSSKALEFLRTLGEPDLFKEAIQYVLPKSLLEPVYHCFYYFEAINLLMRRSKGEDHDAYEAAEGCMVGLKTEIEYECSDLLPSRKDDLAVLIQKPSYKTSMKIISSIQNKIEGWEGPDLFQCATEFIIEGAVIISREGNKKRIDRYVFLFDGLAVCCKPRQGSQEMYRFKEKINLRQIKLTDGSDENEFTSDMKHSLVLFEHEQPYTFCFQTEHEKNEWMAAITHMLTKGTFDRKLDMKLKDEEQDIPQLRPCESYRFYEEDNESNILFDEREEGSLKSSNEALIKACTIHKLIERLTYHEYADPTLVRTFLMTYRSFCSPTNLLELLIDRFHIPLTAEAAEAEANKDVIMMKAVKAFKVKYIAPVQLRVVNVLRHWVDHHYYDFKEDKELLARLEEFISSVKGKKMQKWVGSVSRALDKKKEIPSSTRKIFSQKKLPVEWWLTQNPEEFNILSLHPKDIARQLTLIMSENFRSIHPSELVDASWMKEKKKETASPHLLKHTRFETMVSKWLIKEVVSTENPEERLAIVSRLVDIMAELKSLNNFAGLFAVNATFQSSSVYRLTHTIKRLEARKSQLLEEVQFMASPDKAYKNYQEKLRNINPPCVPFVGMYLSWIVFIRDGNEDQIVGMPENFINFRKRRRLAAILQEILQYQNTPYCIEPEESIQNFLINQKPLGDDSPLQWEEKQFQQSHHIEPKDQPPLRGTRRWKIDLRGPDQSGFLTLTGRKTHRPKASQHEDSDLNSPKSIATSEHASHSQQTPSTPATTKNIGDECQSPTPSDNRPSIPPRTSTAVQAPDLPPRSAESGVQHQHQRSGDSKAPSLPPREQSVSSLPWQSAETNPPDLPPKSPDIRAQSFSLDSTPASPPPRPPPKLPPRSATKERKSSVAASESPLSGASDTPEPGVSKYSKPFHKKPVPLPPNLDSVTDQPGQNSPDISTETSTQRAHYHPPVLSPHSSTTTLDAPPTITSASFASYTIPPRGHQKPPQLPVNSSHNQTGDYPPYDKLAPIGTADISTYDRLIPMSSSDIPPPLPPKPCGDSNPELFSRQISKQGTECPSLPPKPGVSIPPIPPIPPKKPQ